jgi:hypothetical protein
VQKKWKKVSSRQENSQNYLNATQTTQSSHKKPHRELWFHQAFSAMSRRGDETISQGVDVEGKAYPASRSL